MTPDQLTARSLSDDDLRAIPPLYVGPGHERNPFHEVIGDPVGSRNAKAWTQVHGWIVEEDSGPVEPETPMDAIAAALQMEKSGLWYRHEHPNTGAVALFPYQAKDPTEWEAQCQSVHENQTGVEAPEEKPVKEFPGFYKLSRGD